ncbi:MAG: energy-coupling factor ABC transporter ATP-binding protein, partial [FCB group bacterium]|nr:energy-coupling factor ABC transporter ATP-binding protein [FCB group bacterium]
IRLAYFPTPLGINELSLAAGETILLLGSSGCGKSSLLKLIAGFEDPAAGDIRDGRKTALLLQNAQHQIIMQTVEDELRFPLKNAGKNTGDQQKQLDELVDTLGIRHLLDRDMNTLSFGEVQLVMIAATFLTDADIYLLDEPTSHLDPPAIRTCYDYMNCLKERGKTVCVSGQIADEYIFFDRVWIMEKGGIRADIPSDIFAATYREYGLMTDDELLGGILQRIRSGK